METVFIKLLNMSISASWLILAVVIIRLFLKKAPRWSVCILWGLVALKLIVPFSFKSIFSLIPSDEVIPETIATEAHPHITSGIIYVDTAVNPVMEAHLAPQVGDSANPMQIVIFIASLVWCIGMVICLIYAMTSFIILKRKVRASKKISDKINACDDVKSPFILGILRPVIYIPSGMNKDTLDYVIAHENAHLKRGDHFWKPLGFLILSVYWFNPLCWLAYILLCRDIEFACDEKVIRDKDNTYVNSYSQALLDCNAHRRIIAACPLAFGETSVKDRIKGVLNYKKPAFWVVIVAVIICIAVAVCFMTNPKDEKRTGIVGKTTLTASALPLPKYKNDDYFITSCELSASQITYLVDFDEPVEGDRIVEIYFRKEDGSLVTLQQLGGNVVSSHFSHEGDPAFKRYRYTYTFSNMIDTSPIVAVVMNGVEYSFTDHFYHKEIDVPETLRPFLSPYTEKDDTYYVYAYDVCEKLGATIQYDEGDYTICYLNNTIGFSLGKDKIYLNGEERDMGGAAAILEGDELLLPDKYIECLGVSIKRFYPTGRKSRSHSPDEWLITP